MVKTRQKNFRAFIFVEGEAQEIIAYIDKNLGLLQSLLLVFTFTLNHNYATLLEYLKQKKLRFVLANDVESLGLDVKVQEVEKLESKIESKKLESQKLESENVESKMQASTLVLNRTIRSGEEIITEGDLTIFGRINSGAHIQSGGNLQIFGTISGNVFCNGEYMILGEVSEGNVLFGGEIVERELLKYSHNKVYRKNDSIIIEGL